MSSPHTTEPGPNPDPASSTPGESTPGEFAQTLVASSDPTQPSFAPPINRVPGYPFLTAPQADDELGRLGDYRVLAKLGEGGMGYVFRGEDPALQRFVALKVMRPEVAAKEKAAERFLREGRAAAGLKSDHIITIYQVGRANDVPFLAMEFLEGESLEDWIARKRRVVSLVHALHIARDTLRGLATAHDKGLIHRDIKPANLWIEKTTSRIIILDFGLTRTSDAEAQLTQEGAVVGTPAYMAPEQAAGNPVDVRADLFSVGTVVYHLLTGTNPFARESIVATLGAVSFETQPPLVESRPDVAKEYSEFIDRLMAKKPDGRPANARAALAELAAIDKKLNAAKTGTVPAMTSTATVPALKVESPAQDRGAGSRTARVEYVDDGGATEANDNFEVVEEAAPVRAPRPKKSRITRKSAPSHTEKRKSASKTWMMIGGGLFALVAIVAGFLLSGKKDDAPPPPASENPTANDLDRKAAESVINGGGSVTIGGATFASIRNLPGGPWKVTGISRSTEVNATAADADLELYRPLTGLTDLELGPITDAGLARLAGFSRASEFRRLGIAGTSLTDDGLKTVAKFPKLKSLQVVQAPIVTGKGLAHLAGLGIESLDLTRTDIRDAELVHLKGLPRLTGLDLSVTKVSESGLKTVGELTQLVSLKLTNCPNLTDGGIRHFANLKRLQVLGYSSTNKSLSGASLEPVGKLKALKELEISLLDIGVRDVDHIVGLEILERLSLVQNELSDACLYKLPKLKSLKYLNVSKNRITGEAINWYRANYGLVRLKSDFSDE